MGKSCFSAALVVNCWPSAVVRVAVKSLRKRGRWRRSSMRRVVRT
ncbi:MAG TPA: hypothetical protein VK627_02155 [Edaphobacter sp.]|nr:hypothetical protein [Edaphobacter sp.]